MIDRVKTDASRDAARRYPVAAQRLSAAATQSWGVKAIVRLVCHASVGLASLFASVCGALRSKRSLAGRRGDARVVLTGAFMSDNWVAAHVKPLASSPCCSHVWLVADQPQAPIEGATYVCPPRWLRRCVGRVAARSLMLVITAVRRRADIVGGFHLLFNGLLALCVARALGARAIYFCVGGWSEFIAGGAFSGHVLFGRLGIEDRALERRLLGAIRQCDVTITMGSRAKKLLQRRGVNATVLPGGIDGERFRSGSAGAGAAPRSVLPGVQSSDRRPFDIVLVARLDPIKRVDIFLEVVRELVAELPVVRAAVVGDGPLRTALEALNDQLGLGANVTFAGFQSDVAGWLKQARILVITSDSEGLPLSAMEAMTAGLPVVASDVGDLGDLVKHGGNGFLVAPRDVATFAIRILELLRSERKLWQFSSEARRAAESYSLDVARSSWDELLPRLLVGKTRPAPSPDIAGTCNGEWAIELARPKAIRSRSFDADIVFLGDVALAGGIGRLIDQHGTGYPFENLPADFFRADFICFNLECCLSERGQPWEPKPVHFRGSTAYLDVFPQRGGQYVANVANNHFLDYGEDAAADTLEALDARGMLHFGSTGTGSSEDPLILRTEAGSVALLGFAPSAHPLPDDHRVNVAVASPEQMADRVARARTTADIVIVSLHQGLEYSPHIDRRSRRTARRLIDAGADAVVGHHAHVVQAIERYGRGIIFHGIGNLLIDRQAANCPEAAITLALRMTLRERRIERVTVVPCVISECLRPRVLELRGFDRLRGRVATLSNLLTTPSGRARNDLTAGCAWAVDVIESVGEMWKRKGAGTTAAYYTRRLAMRIGRGS